MQLEVPDYFRSDAPIRPRSKIKRREIPRVVLAFCWPLSLSDAAGWAGLSAKSVRTLYLSLRELLLDDRYQRWHGLHLQSPYKLDPVLSAVLWEMLWSCYAECHQNKECQRNFLYGKRAARECGACKILQSEALTRTFDADARAHFLEAVDRTRAFYLERLKMRGEDGLTSQIYKRRVYHQAVITSARYASRITDADGALSVDHFKDGPETVLDLWRTILAHLEEIGELPEPMKA